MNSNSGTGECSTCEMGTGQYTLHHDHDGKKSEKTPVLRIKPTECNSQTPRNRRMPRGKTRRIAEHRFQHFNPIETLPDGLSVSGKIFVKK